MRSGQKRVLMLYLVMLTRGGRPAPVEADWPMAGHDRQRSSWAREDSMPVAAQPLWIRKMEPWVPTKVHGITASGEGNRPDLVFLSTTAGVYAFRADNGDDVWVYATAMPVGHSPTFAAGKLYVACTDATIHCLDAATGRRLWQTHRAGGPFDVNPLVTGGKVYAGCRDSIFYCFDAADGKLLWSYKTEGPISFSAALAHGTVYFAGCDCHAYALEADTGRLLWKSPKLPGEGFYSFWPVVAGSRMLLAGSNYYHIVGSGMGMFKLEKLTRLEAFPKDVQKGDLVGPQDGQGWMEAKQFVQYLTEHPSRQTLHVLDRATGKSLEVAPLCWWGNPGGNRYPPVLGPDGVAWHGWGGHSRFSRFPSLPVGN